MKMMFEEDQSPVFFFSHMSFDILNMTSSKSHKTERHKAHFHFSCETLKQTPVSLSNIRATWNDIHRATREKTRAVSSRGHLALSQLQKTGTVGTMQTHPIIPFMCGTTAPQRPMAAQPPGTSALKAHGDITDPHKDSFMFLYNLLWTNTSATTPWWLKTSRTDATEPRYLQTHFSVSQNSAV